MIVTMWPDGTVISGRTWREVEDVLRSQQWDGYSRRNFRRELRRRAELWVGLAGESVPINSAEATLRALEGLDIIRIEVTGT